MVAINVIAKEVSGNNDKIINSKVEMAEEQNEEPSFSDEEGFTDNVDESDLLGDILRLKPNPDEVLDNVLVVDGIPKVEENRMAKLKTVLNSLFKKCGNLLSEHYPQGPNADKNGEITTKGYCFLEYDSKTAAQDAVAALNGFKLDKVHTFIVTSFRDFENLKKVEDLESWEPPTRRPYKNVGNLRYWLLNPDCMDQYVVQYEGGDMAAVFLNNLTEPIKLTEKQRWSDSFIRWSPFGTYMATLHTKGVVLWGGEKFESINKFSHNGVQFLEFSPAEKFIVTITPPKSKYTESMDAIKVWSIKTGELRRAFSAKADTFKRSLRFKWSFDDQYIATLGRENTLCIYETKGFTMLAKTDAEMPTNVRDFQWSPSALAIAFWLPEQGETPGRVGVWGVVEKRALGTKNLFNLADASIHWQRSGENLCFKTDLYKKKKVIEDAEIKYSGVSVQLEIFHMRSKEIPVTTVEIKEAVQAFGWEPVGNKFCLIQGDMKTYASIYGVKSNPVAVAHLKTLEYKGQINSIFWAPHGQYLVCGNVKSSSASTLMFIDCSNATDVSLINVQEHQGVTDVEWDPTGRYLVSSVSYWSSSTRSMDFGYNIWNFQGRLLARRSLENFAFFAWRPRPPTLLSETKIKEIKKNLKKYAAEFDEKDRKKLDKASLEVSAKRKTLLADFKLWRQEQKERYAEFKEERARLRKEVQNVEECEETIEYLVSQEESIVE